jgi:hypothetical protein
MRLLRVVFVAFASLLVLFAAAMSDATSANNPKAVSEKDFNANNFGRSTTINNKWFPLKPGTQLHFTGFTVEGKERVAHRVIFTVTDLTKVIGGVRNVVLWDRDFAAGELVEAEVAFFAQDNNGHVWQLGEYPEEYEEGKRVAAPTWMHGLKGAKAGLTMPANPQLGMPSYSLGWGPAVGFNDRAKVFKTGQKTCVPVRCFQGVLVTDEYNPDEPGKHQYKYYAQGVGNVRVGWGGKNETTQETLVLSKVVNLGAAELAKVRAEALKLEKSAYKVSKAVYAKTAPMTQASARKAP